MKSERAMLRSIRSTASAAILPAPPVPGLQRCYRAVRLFRVAAARYFSASWRGYSAMDTRYSIASPSRNGRHFSLLRRNRFQFGQQSPVADADMYLLIRE
ncbi:hypothetical protein KCP76_15270 [Salmonella enterica subsp. enterica serovar Weltevreden]|nr:hypothetical protein KCP76_15270 [Salmonella enterica subsp. enterica serovar Weltevreden]